MKILQRAPMLGVLISLVSGLALYERAGIWAFIIAVPVIFAAVIFCSYVDDFPEQWNVFIFALVFVVACSAWIYLKLSIPPESEITLTNETGTITNLREWGKIYVAVIDTENHGKFAVKMQFAELMTGTRIKFDGVTEPFKLSGNFDEGKFWRAQGVKAWLKIYDTEELPAKFSIPRLRYKISRFISIYMPELTSLYLKAMMLGERHYILNVSHRKWGTSHLLAVSGFHVVLVVSCAVLIFGWDIILLSVIMWSYILLTGCAVSAMRAGLMLQAGLLSRVLGRPVESVNSVSVAGVSLLVHSPFMFWDIGFRLSVLAALTLAALPRKKYAFLLFSPAIWLTTFPQAAYTFESVPLASVILNLFAPVYFSFAFIMACVNLLLRILLMIYSVSVEGVFILFDKIANFWIGILPDFLNWNYFTAWLGTAAIIFFVCRHLGFSLIRTISVIFAGSFLAFVIFL